MIAIGKYYKDPEYLCQGALKFPYAQYINYWKEGNVRRALFENGIKFLKIFFRNKIIFFLLKKDNHLISNISYEKKNNVIKVSRFYIRLEFRGKGYCKALLNELIDIAKKICIEELKLHTFLFHTVFPLYLKAPFEYFFYFSEVSFKKETSKLVEIIFISQISTIDETGKIFEFYSTSIEETNYVERTRRN